MENMRKIQFRIFSQKMKRDEENGLLALYYKFRMKKNVLNFVIIEYFMLHSYSVIVSELKNSLRDIVIAL